MASINVSTDQHASRHAPGGADPINMGLIQDGAVAGFVNTPGSSTRTATDALYALPGSGGAFNLLYRNASNVLAWTTSQASVAHALGWIVATDPTYGVVADWAGGSTGTDNTTALQAAINAGPIVWLPAGYYRYTGNLTLGQHSQLMGAGWSALAQESYGDPLWISASGYTRYKGTVLYCSATTGNAITGDSAVGGRWRLNGFMLIGPGTGTSNGISICQTLSFNIRPNLRDIGVFNFGGTGYLIGGTNEGQFDSLTSYACQTGFNFGPNFNANSVTNIECQRSTVDGIVVSGYGNSFHGGIIQNTAGNTGLHVATNSPGNTFTRFYAENSSCTDPVLFESETKFSGKFASNLLSMRITVAGCVLDHVYAPSTTLTFGSNLAKNVLIRCSFSSVTRNGSDILDMGSRVGGTSSPVVGIGNDTPWQFERTDAEASLRLKDTVNSHYIADFYPAATDAGSLIQFHGLIGSGASVSGSLPNAGNFAASVRWYNTTTKKPIWGDGAVFRDARGYITPLATKTANYTLVDGDRTVVFNGASLTATLPDPTTVTADREWIVKNINASALTVVSAGTSKTIDGAASQTLPQWARGQYVSDGTQWLMLTGNPPIGTVSTAPETAVSTTTSLTSAALGTSVACTVTTAFTLTLPTPVGVTGQQITVRVVPSSTKLLTLATAAGNIDGQSTRIMWAGESATLLSDGTNWVKIAGKTIPMRCALTMTAAQTLPSGSVTTATLDTTALDNTGLMATLASNAITVQRPGTYTVLARAGLDQLASQGVRFISQAQKNGTTVIVQQETSPASGAIPTFVASDDVTLAAGDLVRLQAYQACTTPATRNFAVGAAAAATALTMREIPAW